MTNILYSSVVDAESGAMKTEEGRLKDQVKELLTSLGAYYFMPVQSGYGRQGIDFFCCVKGKFVGIETKAPGKKPTLRQDQCIMEIARAGGAAIWSDNLQDIKNFLSMLR